MPSLYIHSALCACIDYAPCKKDSHSDLVLNRLNHSISLSMNIAGSCPYHYILSPQPLPVTNMSMAALKGDSAFQARSLVSTLSFPPIPSSTVEKYSLFFWGGVRYQLTPVRTRFYITVPLPSPPVLPVRRLQLPRVRQAEDEGRLSGAPR